ncbi:MAG: 50S ribosomal protein L28 [Planctomycetota bacterium]
MSRECEVCHKRTVAGRQYTHRGLAKHKGGVGIKTTGITARMFVPNVQNLRVQLTDGTVKRGKICTKCIRSGRVRKPMKRDIPEGLRARMVAKEEAKSPAARRVKAKQAGERRRARRAEAKARAAKKA